jgi:hypothetical protein
MLLSTKKGKENSLNNLFSQLPKDKTVVFTPQTHEFVVPNNQDSLRNDLSLLLDKVTKQENKLNVIK